MAKLTWTTVRRRVCDLIEFEGNPQEQNDWSLPALKKSLKTYDVVETPVIDADGTLLAGHGRKKALVEISFWHLRARGESNIISYIPYTRFNHEQTREKNKGFAALDIQSAQSD